jgi:hypothetical protein
MKSCAVVGQVQSWKLRDVVISHSFAFSASRRLKFSYKSILSCTAFPSTLVSMLELSPPLPVLRLLRVGGLSRLNTRALHPFETCNGCNRNTINTRCVYWWYCKNYMYNIGRYNQSCQKLSTEKEILNLWAAWTFDKIKRTYSQPLTAEKQPKSDYVTSLNTTGANATAYNWNTITVYANGML